MKCEPKSAHRSKLGFTLTEVAVSMGILGLLFGGVISGYVQNLHRAEWAAYNLAANSLAQQRVEQARAAKWDTLAAPPVDELVSANFPSQIEVLDVPISGNNPVFATNFTVIGSISTTPPVKSIQVNCVWAYHNGHLFTNTVVTYRAPDQ